MLCRVRLRKSNHDPGLNFNDAREKVSGELEFDADGNLISGTFTGLLVSETAFTGRRNHEKPSQQFSYDLNDDGTYAISERTDYIYDANGKLIHTYTFDTADQGMSFSEARQKTSGELTFNEDGFLIDGSFTGELISETLFEGRKGKERPSQSFTYEKNEDGSYTILERTDYVYENNALIQTYTFDTSEQGLNFSEAREKSSGVLSFDENGFLIDGSFTGELVSETMFTGAKGKEKPSQTFTYAVNEDGSYSITERTDFIYENGRLIHSYTFNTDDQGLTFSEARQKTSGELTFDEDGFLIDGSFTGELVSETKFTGPSGKERPDQSFNYEKNEDGSYSVVERTDYIYEGGQLAHTYTFNTDDQGLTFSEAREKTSGELTFDEDGNLIDGSFTGELVSETVYQGAKGREKPSQTFSYELNEDGTYSIVERTDYIYVDGKLKHTYSFDTTGVENFSEAREKASGELTFDNDGNLISGSFSGDLVSETLYEGSKGKERPSQTFTYELNGDGTYSITERTDYIYVAGKLKHTYTFDTGELESFNASREKASGELTFDDNGNLIGGNFTGELISETLFEGGKGREKPTQSFSYQLNDDGSYSIVERTDYIYEDGKLKHTYSFNTEDQGLTFSEAREKASGELTFDEDGNLIDGSFTGELVSETLYEGSKGKEKPSQTFSYEKNDDGSYSIIERVDYVYVGGKLRHTYTFDTSELTSFSDAREKASGELTFDDNGNLIDGNFMGKLVSETLYKGSKGRERQDQTFRFELNGDGSYSIIERTDYIYENGKLARSYTFDTLDVSRFSEAREKASGELVFDEDGNLISGTFTGDLISETTFEGPKGQERPSQAFQYQKNLDGSYSIVERTDYIYEGKRLVNTISYDTEGIEFSEAREAGIGEEISKSYFEGARGREELVRITNANGLSIYDMEGTLPVDPRDLLENLPAGATATYVAGYTPTGDWNTDKRYLDTITFSDGSNYKFVYIGGSHLNGIEKVYYSDTPNAGTENWLVQYGYVQVGADFVMDLISYSNHWTIDYQYVDGNLARTVQFKDSDSLGPFNGEPDAQERVRSITY